MAAVLERRTEVGPLRLDHERRDVKINCSCPYPSLYQKLSRTAGEEGSEFTAYGCREVRAPRGENDEVRVSRSESVER